MENPLECFFLEDVGALILKDRDPSLQKACLYYEVLCENAIEIDLFLF